MLLPALNAHLTLGKAISSTLRALDRQDELLVLIEGDNQNTYDLSQVDDPRLKIFFRTGSKGISSALNFLLARAAGRYVARMDADDFCTRGRFTRQLNHLEKNSLDLVFSSAILFGKQIKPFGAIPQIPYKLSPEAAELILCIANPFVHSTMTAKKEVLVALGGYKNVKSEDYELWLRAAANGFKLGRAPTFDVFYRVHYEQATQSSTPNRNPDPDKLISESLNSLVEVLVKRGTIADSLNFRDQANQVLRRINPAYYFLSTPLMNSIRIIANKLLDKR